ncbi:MAG: TonB-dependent receptor [Candidatus Aminicenantes bacterium]|nr:MAG: TonB-dependent receptor [Candidatus Aminicenantes bacterium]
MSKVSSIKKLLISLTILFTACFLINGRAFAQATVVTLQGVITDEEGTSLPGTEVTARNAETGYVHSTITRVDGTYIISGIQPGKYEVQVILPGFKTQIRKGMTFAVGAKLKVDFVLEVATVEEEITVIGESPMVEVTKSEISSVIDRQKIEDLPLLDRDFGDLSVLQAGVIGGRSNAMPNGMGEVIVDGISNEGIIQNTTGASLPADAIQEFRIMTNQAAAEFGNAAGLIRTAITRSGTNNLRGRLAYFYRDEALDTSNYFLRYTKYKGDPVPKDEQEKAPYQIHNFEGNIGGPIQTDKAHFFLLYRGVFETEYATITAPLVETETLEQTFKEQVMLAKFNYQLNEKNLFSLRFTYEPESGKNFGVGGMNTRERAYDYKGGSYGIVGHWTMYPSDNTMNEVRAQYYKRWGDSDPIDNTQYSIRRPGGNFGKHTNLAQHNYADRTAIADNFSLFLGNHTLKLGAEYMWAPSGVDVFDLLIPGYYYFFTDEPFDPNNPATYPFMFIYNEGDPAFDLPYHFFALFVQDSWRIHPRLTLNFGLRWNYYDCIGLDEDNFNIRQVNPRFGFSYDPVGDGRTSIRGGVGTYTANNNSNPAFPAIFYSDVQQTTQYYPGYPDPSIPNPFVPSAEIPATYAEYRETPIVAPWTFQATIGVQREIITDFSVSADLVYSKGHNMIHWENLNPIIPGTTYIHEDPTRGDVLQVVNQGKSEYKALYLTFAKRYSHGWAIDIAYTLSKSMGNTEDDTNRPWSYEDDAWERNWGRTNTDARHKITAAGTVDIPLGFQLSGIFYYRSAYPWNARYAGDENKDGIGADYYDYSRNSREGFDWMYINVRLSKFINISDFRLQFFGEFYNLTNRNNFYNVYNTYGRDAFGEPRSAGDPRMIQLGVRFDWR